MEIRQLDTGDAAALAHYLAREARSVELEPASFLAAEHCVAYGAFAEGELVGCAWGHDLPRPDGPSMLLLYSLEVEPSHRRQGAGRALVEAFVSHARRLGCHKLWLTTQEANEPARSLYDSAGGVARPTSAFYQWTFDEDP